MSALVQPADGATRRTLGIIALAIVLGGLAYTFALHWPAATRTPVFLAPVPSGCDLRQGPCTARFASGETLSLDIEPKTLPPMQPLRVTVETSGFEARQIRVEFSGVSMNMGVNRADLLEVGEHSFAGEAILPICIRRRMDWEAKVTARGPDGAWQSSFFFETRQP